MLVDCSLVADGHEGTRPAVGYVSVIFVCSQLARPAQGAATTVDNRCLIITCGSRDGAPPIETGPRDGAPPIETGPRDGDSPITRTAQKGLQLQGLNDIIFLFAPYLAGIRQIIYTLLDVILLYAITRLSPLR